MSSTFSFTQSLKTTLSKWSCTRHTYSLVFLALTVRSGPLAPNTLNAKEDDKKNELCNCTLKPLMPHKSPTTQQHCCSTRLQNLLKSSAQDDTFHFGFYFSYFRHNTKTVNSMDDCSKQHLNRSSSQECHQLLRGWWHLFFWLFVIVLNRPYLPLFLLNLCKCRQKLKAKVLLQSYDYYIYLCVLFSSLDHQIFLHLPTTVSCLPRQSISNPSQTCSPNTHVSNKKCLSVVTIVPRQACTPHTSHTTFSSSVNHWCWSWPVPSARTLSVTVWLTGTHTETGWRTMTISESSHGKKKKKKI